MNGIPSVGDRLTAKVDLTVYVDRDCKKQFPPLFPGPYGLRKSTQYPGTRKQGETVGTFTGNSSPAGYEVKYELVYNQAYQKFPFGWGEREIRKPVIVWVDKTQVTGNWDKGPDAPKVEERNDETGNTTMYLGLAVAAAAVVKVFKRNS